MMLPAHRVIIAVYTLLHEGYAVQLRNNVVFTVQNSTESHKYKYWWLTAAVQGITVELWYNSYCHILKEKKFVKVEFLFFF